MELPGGEKRLGSIILFELFGTALICGACNLTEDILTISVIYFVAVLLTFTITGAHLNPALTFCIYVAEAEWKKNLQPLVLTIFAQILGCFLGLEIGLLLRIVYNTGTSAIPAFEMKVPPVDDLASEEYFLTVLMAEAISTMLYAVFFLVIKKNAGEKDVVVMAFMLAAVFYAMQYLAVQTSGGVLNPAIALAYGFNDQWHYNFAAGGLTESPLWDWHWIAWLTGPMLGAGFAPFMTKYQMDIVERYNK